MNAIIKAPRVKNTEQIIQHMNDGMIVIDVRHEVSVLRSTL